MQVLVINSGSSSVKFQVFAMDPARPLLRGEVQRMGSEDARLWVETPAASELVDGPTRIERAVVAGDHREALGVVFGAVRDASLPVDLSDLAVVGHRIVHGGERFEGPVVIDDEVVRAIGELALLAPVHTKAGVAGIESAREWLPDVPHVAVFDTTFHRTIPPHAREYALPRELAREHGIRRYGFHGTSHAFVSRRATQLLGTELEDTDLITLHLGNGASVSAIHGGRSVDTSMGLTPLEGLVMGTRCGDVDPAVPMLLSEITGRSREDVHRLMNFESGLKGLCGESDMTAVHRLAEASDEDARLAIEMFCYRAKKYVGAYFAALGRVDAVVFTAGIGEHDPEIRARICAGLERLGIRVDAELNMRTRGEGFISPPGAEVAALVIPTDEEREIAREAMACALGSDAGHGAEQQTEG